MHLHQHFYDFCTRTGVLSQKDTQNRPSGRKQGEFRACNPPVSVSQTKSHKLGFLLSVQEIHGPSKDRKIVRASRTFSAPPGSVSESATQNLGKTDKALPIINQHSTGKQNPQRSSVSGDPLGVNAYFMKPFGFLHCQFQASRHISVRLFSAFQPRIASLLLVSA